MKIQIVSDLHLEFIERKFSGFTGVAPAPEAQLLILAGDIHTSTHGLDLFASWPVPVIYVPGNHEYYGTDYGLQRETFVTANGKAFPSVIGLERGVFEYKGIRFAGTTLWTDYELYGERKLSRRIAASQIRDYRAIRYGVRTFRTRDSLHEHLRSVAWLKDVLGTPYRGQTVVVTHHAPHPLSIEMELAGHPLNPAFASDLSRLMGKCALWIHGHVHGSCDYWVEGTRILANPRGYPENISEAMTAGDLLWENRAFEPLLVVNVGS